MRADLVQSIAAFLSANSSLSKRSGSISTFAFRDVPSPVIGFLFATFFPTVEPAARPRAGPLGSGPRAERGGPLFRPVPLSDVTPGGPRLGPAPGGPLLGIGPLPVGPETGPVCGPL